MAHGAATAYSGIVRSSERTVLIDATPATVGINTVAVTVLDPAGKPAKVEQWSAIATRPGVGDVRVPLKSFGAGVATADPRLPVTGKWTFTVTIRVAGADPVSVSDVIPIGFREPVK